jgi:hypothetical protein
MRSLLIAFLMAGSAWTATLPKLTVLLSIEGKAAPVALDEMKSELTSIMQDAGRDLDIRMRSQSQPSESYDDVILVKLKGTCEMDRLIPVMDERGPLASTHATNGVILPFAEVQCTRLANSVAGALFGGEKKQANKFLGRAMGRVLAHELYHILGRTHEHNPDGSLASEAISVKRLIADKRITFDTRDLSRMLP